MFTIKKNFLVKIFNFKLRKVNILEKILIENNYKKKFFN